MTKRKYDYILRTCRPDLTSNRGSFQWSEKGPVEAPDWDPTPQYGGGLHGFLNGAGCGGFADWSPEAKWLVVRIKKGEYVDLGDKVKFPRGEVIFCGSRFDATNFIARFAPEGTAIIGRTFEGKNAVVGYRGTATTGAWGKASAGVEGMASAGDGGTASAGDGGTASAGAFSTASVKGCGAASAGNFGTAVAGIDGTASAGLNGTASAGIRGTATAGNFGTASADDFGTASAGHKGTASAGVRGTATAGYRGTASAGVNGIVSAGEKGIIAIKYFDRGRDRIRNKTGYIGEDGLRPNIKYRLDEDHNFVEAE